MLTFSLLFASSQTLFRNLVKGKLKTKGQSPKQWPGTLEVDKKWLFEKICSSKKSNFVPRLSISIKNQRFSLWNTSHLWWNAVRNGYEFNFLEIIFILTIEGLQHPETSFRVPVALRTYVLDRYVKFVMDLLVSVHILPRHNNRVFSLLWIKIKVTAYSPKRNFIKRQMDAQPDKLTPFRFLGKFYPV